MDRIKFSLNDKESYPVEREIFEIKTQKKFPFYQDIKLGEQSQFAICPECNNPVQAVGLYKPLVQSEQPFAKHCAQPVLGIGTYDKEAYDYCPYRANRKYFTKDSRKGAIDDIAKNIVIRMVAYFDKIISLLQKKIGFYISTSLAESMLDDFFRARAYLYRGATLRNIPLLLPYFSLNQRLIGRWLLDQELIEKIRDTKGIYLDDNKVKAYKYVNIGFYFTQHQTHLNAHHLSESLIFRIEEGELDNAKLIYKKKIIFDNNHFDNLIKFTPQNLTDKAKKRNEELLSIAKTVAEKYGFRFSQY